MPRYLQELTKVYALSILKVVPLSQRSGIVEWCENTVPLGEYLVGIRGIGGAHSKYHPTDWAAAECRKKFSVRGKLETAFWKTENIVGCREKLTNFPETLFHDVLLNIVVTSVLFLWLAIQKSDYIISCF